MVAHQAAPPRPGTPRRGVEVTVPSNDVSALALVRDLLGVTRPSTRPRQLRFGEEDLQLASAAAAGPGTGLVEASRLLLIEAREWLDRGGPPALALPSARSARRAASCASVRRGAPATSLGAANTTVSAACGELGSSSFFGRTGAHGGRARGRGRDGRDAVGAGEPEHFAGDRSSADLDHARVHAVDVGRERVAAIVLGEIPERYRPLGRPVALGRGGLSEHQPGGQVRASRPADLKR